MLKFLSKNLFWVLQLLGWGGLSFFFAYAANLSEKPIGLFILTLGNLVVFVGVSSLLRLVLKKFVPLQGFNSFSVLKIVIAILITTLIFPTVAYYFGYLIGKLTKLLFDDSFNLFSKKPKEATGFGKYLVYFVIVTGWTIFYYIIKLLRQSNDERLNRLKLKDQVRQAQLNTLKGHINPQFIFSSLNNIKGLMLEDVSKSRAMLTTLSEMLRYSLTKNNINAVALSEELEIAKNYIAILEIEGRERLKMNFEIAPETLQLQIPPLLLTNLIELATRFGVLNSKEGGEIFLGTEIKNDNLRIALIHNAKALISKPRQVLENTLKQRLKLLYGANASFMANYEIDKNTLTVLLPINPIKTAIA